jgi:hypothetical protein
LVTVPVGDQTLTVANLYQQATTRSSHPHITCHLRYCELVQALVTLKGIYKGTGAHFGFPKYMGCGLAGGNWLCVETLLNDIFEDEQATIVEYIS